MSEEPKVPPEDSSASADTSWQEVGRQFQSLGESLAHAVRTAWEDEENQRRLQAMRVGLEAMVHEVSQAIDESAKTPQGQRVKEDATRAADSVRAATEKTVHEVRPQLIDALQQLNAELEKFIKHMEEKRTPPTDAPKPGQ